MKTNKTHLLIIFLTIFIDLLGFGIIIPILPFYAEHFGASALQIGLLSMSYSLMQFIFAPVWGRISDRIGRRPVLLFCLAGTAIGHILFGFADSLIVLFISRSLTGIAAASIPVAMAYISDVTTPENRAKGMGMVGAAFGLGFIFGPAIGGVLSQYGYPVPIFFAAGLSFVAASLAYFKLPESLKFTDKPIENGRKFNLTNLKNAITNPTIGILFIIFFLITLSFANLETMFALFTERKYGFDATTNGYLFALVGIISATVQGVLIGPLVKKFGEKKLISFSILLLSAGFILFPLANSMYLFVPAVAMISFAIGVHNPSVITLISKNTPPEKQGGILGLNQSLGSLARVLGPIWGGYFFDTVGIGFPFLSAGILIFLIFFLSLRLYKIDLKQSHK
ncbi:MFS transporter [Calditrichota bacterium]